MITIKAKRGHIIRVLSSLHSLGRLDNDDEVLGVAECASCGTIMGFTCSDPPKDSASMAELHDHMLSHLEGLIDSFEEEPCVPDDAPDLVLDWTTRNQETPPPGLPS